MSESTIQCAFRLPKTMVAAIDAHAKALERARPYERSTRASAAIHLLAAGLEACEQDPAIRDDDPMSAPFRPAPIEPDPPGPVGPFIPKPILAPAPSKSRPIRMANGPAAARKRASK